MDCQLLKLTAFSRNVKSGLTGYTARGSMGSYQHSILQVLTRVTLFNMSGSCQQVLQEFILYLQIEQVLPPHVCQFVHKLPSQSSAFKVVSLWDKCQVRLVKLSKANCEKTKWPTRFARSAPSYPFSSSFSSSRFPSRCWWPTCSHQPCPTRHSSSSCRWCSSSSWARGVSFN